MYFYTNAVYLPQSTIGVYVDIDIPSYEPTFPIDASFAVVLVQNASTSTVSFAARHPNQVGYDDYVSGNTAASTYTQHIVPVLNGKISVKMSSLNVFIYLVGYLGKNDATYLSDGTPVAPNSPGWGVGTWATIDLTNYGVPSHATFAIGIVSHTSTSNAFALRPYGSAETRQPGYAPLYMPFIMPVFDGKIQVYRENLSDTTFIIRVLGYMTDGYPAATGVLRNTETTGSYQSTTVSTTPQVKALLGHAWNTGSTSSSSVYSHAVRKSGSTDDYYGTLYYQAWFLIPLSAAGAFEQKLSSATVDLYDYGQVDSPTANLSESVSVSDTLIETFFTETLTESVKVSDDSDNNLTGFLLPAGAGAEGYFEDFGDLTSQSVTVSDTLAVDQEPYRTKENITVSDTLDCEIQHTGRAALSLPLPQVEDFDSTGFVGNASLWIPVWVIAEGDIGTVGQSYSHILRVEVFGTGITSGSSIGAVELPMLTMAGEGFGGHAGSAALILRLPELAGRGDDSSAQLSLPRISVAGTGDIGAVGVLSASLSVFVAGAGIGASATALGDVVGDGEIILPQLRTAGSLVSDTKADTAINIPIPQLVAVGATGCVGEAALTFPIAVVAGTGHLNAVGTSEMWLPMLTCFGLSIVDVAQAVNSLSYHAVNTMAMAVTDYTGYAFNSIAMIDGEMYGATATGIYKIAGDTDSGAAIQTIVTKRGLLGENALNKRLTEAYYDLDATAAPTMASWAGAVCVDVGTTDISSGRHMGKSHLPRGHVDSSVGVSVIGNQGQIKELVSIELLAETSVSSRRRR